MATSTRIDISRLRSYSAAFSRACFEDILQFGDFGHIDWVYKTYDSNFYGSPSYLDYFKCIYNVLAKEYRCEYVYKNEIIGKILPRLIKMCGSHKTVAFNEFKVGQSIADIAFFNGESKAFEIKTDLDSPKRLTKQLSDYKKIFDKCYLVIPADKLELYSSIADPTTGIILLTRSHGQIYLKTYQEASKNENIDIDILMKCLRTSEYKQIIQTEFGELPNVPGYMLFDSCREMFNLISTDRLKGLFLDVIKERKNNTDYLIDVPKEFRQACLSLSLSKPNIDKLLGLLNEQIN